MNPNSAPTTQTKDREYFDALPEVKTEDRAVPVSKTDQALASSAKSRINLPINIANWRDQPPEVVETLVWFHQWLLDHEITWDDAAKAIQSDRSTVFRLLKGTYAARDWTKICDKIRGFRTLQAKRAKIQRNIFVPNRISALISAGLDYAMATNSICLIVGESRLGKTEAGRDWKERNNHGRTVMVEVPPIGGPKAVLLEIAKAVGVNRNTSVPVMLASVVRAFNENRMIIVDEVHRCLSASRTATPIALEVIRYIRDRSGCAVGLLATHRFTSGLSASTYQYEQLVGRIGMPILLPTTVETADVLPILQQFVAEPGPKLIDQMLAIANGIGRFGVMVETLKLASKLAGDAGETLHDSHVMKALAMRRAMEARELLEGGRK